MSGLIAACGSEGGGDGQSGTNITTVTAGTAPTLGTSTGTGSVDDGAPTGTANSGDATTAPNDGTGTTDETSGAASSPASGGTTEEGIKLDIGLDTEVSGPDTAGSMGCKKIDFLFVVDNSESMTEEQQSLVSSFPGFIASIQDTVMAKDYHVMVVDTDSATSLAQTCGALCQGATDCKGIPCDIVPEPGSCGVTLGGGLTADPNFLDCGVSGGHRYMLDSQPALSETFACVAKVGTFGNGDELPMDAMIDAVTTLNGPGGCNDGFMRKDGLLVVTFLTDEEDVGKSMGEPADWKAALLAAKNGDEASLVVLGLIGDNDQPGALCSDDLAEASPRLRSFAESFTFGSWSSICAEDYAPFFDAAVDPIDAACDQFDPPI